MWTFLLGVTFGLLASTRSEQLQVNFRGCSFKGVFLVEGANRHSLNFDMAQKVCLQLDSIMATLDQLREAFDIDMETCRYGWTSNMSTAILRHTAHENCALNMTGFITNPRTAEELYDTYCYDDKAASAKDCTKAFKSPAYVPSAAPASPQPQAPTTADDLEDTTPKARTEDASGGEGGDTTVSPGEDAVGDVIEFTPTVTTPLTEVSDRDDSDAFTEVTFVETNPFGERENSSVGSTFTPGQYDQPAGSGMMPTHYEEETVTPMAPDGEPEETHLPTETNQHETIGSVADDEVPKQQPNDRLDQGQQESSSSNWLVILLVIVAVAAILLVCAAVVKRKSWCGKQQTLMITSKDGGEGNGAAASASSSHAQEREQEMVTLMNKEKIQENGNTEEFTVITLEESPDKEQLA
ncbi:lymphatic vessel endothelial hyaluronic acid receptor 1 [Centropristis striata]|uniref:lymphatic vessel endothelial hyaluronic acid receptor 1 n=1 Tax=Centropristis striata TaxID=184440 RepID=UPI0027DEB6D8|nr:lymphatic vessel endothelial hyaluronic acid receptor 1 [Centropristis striata]